MQTPYDRLAHLSELARQAGRAGRSPVVPEIAHWVVATDVERAETNLMLYDYHDEFPDPPPWWGPDTSVQRREFEAVRFGEAVYQRAGRIMPGYAAVSWGFRRRFDHLPARIRKSIDKTWRKRVARHPGLFEALVDAVRVRESDAPSSYYSTLTRHIVPPQPGMYLREVRWGFRCVHCDKRSEGHLCNVIPRPGGGRFRCAHCEEDLAYHPVWVGSIGDDDVVAGFVTQIDGPVHFDNIEAHHVA